MRAQTGTEVVANDNTGLLKACALLPMTVEDANDKLDGEDDVLAVENEVVRVMSVVYTEDRVDCVGALDVTFDTFVQLPSLPGRQFTQKL